LNDIEKRIVDYLNNEKDATINQIANSLNLHRTTCSKYLAILEAKGFLNHRNIGKAKLYSLNRENSKFVENDNGSNLKNFTGGHDEN
jgi:predicted transcriptional regulator